jgi:transketolase
VCCREGRDLAFIATGSMVAISKAAADLLAPQGISAAVYSAPWVRPLDHDEICKLGSRYPIVATAEEGVVGGLGATVGRILAEAASGARLVCFGIREDTIAPTLSQDAARRHFGLDAESMAGRIAAVLV